MEKLLLLGRLYWTEKMYVPIPTTSITYELRFYS